MALTGFIKNFLKDEEGATAVEYAVMIVLIVVVCLLTVKFLGSNVEVGFNTVGDEMNQTLGGGGS